MRFILGSLALGAGCWFAFMVYTGAVATWSGEQQYIAMLQEYLAVSIEEIGVFYTSLLPLAAGCIVSFGIIAFGPGAHVE